MWKSGEALKYMRVVQDMYGDGEIVVTCAVVITDVVK